MQKTPTIMHLALQMGNLDDMREADFAATYNYEKSSSCEL